MSTPAPDALKRGWVPLLLEIGTMPRLALNTARAVPMEIRKLLFERLPEDY